MALGIAKRIDFGIAFVTFKRHLGLVRETKKRSIRSGYLLRDDDAVSPTLGARVARVVRLVFRGLQLYINNPFVCLIV